MESYTKKEIAAANKAIEENPRHRKWLAAYLNVESDTYFNSVRSTFAADYDCSTYSSAGSIGCRIKKLLSPLIREHLEIVGLSAEAVAAKFLDLMESKKMEYFSNRGSVVTSREVAALEIQHKAADSVAKILGLYAPIKSESTNVNVDGGKISAEQRELLDDVYGDSEEEVDGEEEDPLDL